MATEAESPDGQKARRRLLSTPEGRVLLTGFALACLYFVGMVLTRVWSVELFGSLLAMTTTHVIGGRFAGISWGYTEGLSPWLIIGVNLAIEAILVLHFYPLFVLSYRKLIVIGPLKDAMARAQSYAEARQGRIMKYGVPGLLLFVWFPFWMTGPLVGSIIGFLIGLRPWVNMTVVIAGTGLATVCWGLALEQLHTWLARLGTYVPLVVVALIILVAVSIHIRHTLWPRANGAQAHDEDGQH